MNDGYWNCCILLVLVGGGAGVGHRGEWNALMEMLRLVQLRARISLFSPDLFKGSYIPEAVIKYSGNSVWLRRRCSKSFNIQLLKLWSLVHQVLAPKEGEIMMFKLLTSRSVTWVTWEGHACRVTPSSHPSFMQISKILLLFQMYTLFRLKTSLMWWVSTITKQWFLIETWVLGCLELTLCH